jgi:hypothetical protein
MSLSFPESKRGGAGPCPAEVLGVRFAVHHKSRLLLRLRQRDQEHRWQGMARFLIRLAVRAALFALPSGRGPVFVHSYMLPFLSAKSAHPIARC